VQWQPALQSWVIIVHRPMAILPPAPVDFIAKMAKEERATRPDISVRRLQLTQKENQLRVAMSPVVDNGMIIHLANANARQDIGVRRAQLHQPESLGTNQTRRMVLVKHLLGNLWAHANAMRDISVRRLQQHQREIPKTHIRIME
jgi:type II secretory pathway component PulM